MLDDCAPVELLPYGDLAAIVTRVPRALFEGDVLQARLKDAAWLESAVRWHQSVVEAFHRERGVLPAKLGCVYAHSADLVEALAPVHDALRSQLDRLAGCDEWGVRLYADRSIVERRVTKEDPRMHQLQQELAGARPGRAYLLRRKLADLIGSTTDQWLSEVAQAGYDRLLCCSVDGQIGPRPNGVPVAVGDAEVLRADFLVSRANVDRLVDEIHRFIEGQEGLRCEYSGPWPPYSFARLGGEDSR